MIKINYCDLDFDRALEYFQDNLIETNALSSEIMKLIDFKSGKFFTFLPNNVNESKIYNFQHGGIATATRGYAQDFILNKLKFDNKLFCVFDDFSTTFTAEYQYTIFLSYGLYYEKEVYYIISQELAAPEILQECFYASDAIWHSLCILSKYDFSHKKEKELTLKEIDDICKETVLIVVGAYDAEGYVFWENSSSGLK